MAKLYVSNKDQTIRIFRSDFLEFFTRVHPAVPLIIFVPVVEWMIYRGYSQGAGIGLTMGMFMAGLAVWTLTEYVVHRFVFHVGEEIENDTREKIFELAPGEPALPRMEGWEQRHYFVAHGVHHEFPNDTRRLVMPPILSVPLAFLFYFLFRVPLGPVLGPLFFGGFVTGYLFYDMTHYAVHHFSMRTRLGRFLKKHHYRHHYEDPDRNYGVSSPVWDYIFGTFGRLRR